MGDAPDLPGASGERTPPLGNVRGIGGLLPSPPRTSIVRPALESRLAQAAERRLTFICAGPGWGKTVAVAQWVINRPEDATPVAWVTLQPRIDDPASFWQAAIDALVTASDVGVGHPLRSLSTSGGMPDEVLTALLQALDVLPRPVLLVVDDFHEASDPRLLESVARVANLSRQVRLVLISRVVPTLRIHRLRVAGELSEVSAEDLAFSRAEVRRLAHGQSLVLTDAEAATIEARTEGWPAGVQLALLQVSRHGTGALAAFRGSERSVAEYLLAEVLERNDPGVRDFLLRTSVVQPLCAELASAIVPGAPAQQILEGLEARNEFVTALGPDRRWFRYHPLLRDMLGHALHRDRPEARLEAHRAAADWWASHGDPIEALSHALAVDDRAQFARIYASGAAPALVGARRDALRACLVAACRTWGDDTSGAAELQRAGLAFLEGRGQALRGHLEAAREAFDRDRTAEPAARALLELLSVAAHRFTSDPVGVSTAARRALSVLDAADPFPAADGYRLVAQHNVAIAQLWSGHVVPAGAQLRHIVGLAAEAESSGADLTLLAARSHLALALVMEGKLAEAQGEARAALEHAVPRGWVSLLQVRPTHVALALAHLMRGEVEDAERAMASALAAVLGGSEAGPTLLLHCLQVEVAAARGRIRGAQHAAALIASDERDVHSPTLLQDAVEHALTEAALLGPKAADAMPIRGNGSVAPTPTQLSCAGRRLLARGDHVGARTLVTPVTRGVQPESVFDQMAVIEAWLVTALANDRDGGLPAAAAAVQRAVELAAPAGLVRPFLGMGSPRLPVLLKRATGGSGEHHAFVETLTTRLGSAEEPEPEPLLEPLTERELAMLRALPTLKSNTEIAADAYISVNTVKAHLKGLYRKLGVSSRREAVERARELGILP